MTAPEAEAAVRIGWTGFSELPRRAADWVRAQPLLFAAIAAGLIVRITYWAVTDRRLDDALITIKHAKNVADGVGLTHHLGEDGPVHGFTSVLSVLIPLPGELIASGGSFVVIRLVSLVAFVFAAIFAYRICRRLELGSWPIGFALAYLALDHNQILYGVAGMETQIAVAVLLGGVHYVLEDRPRAAGIALGLALLARPDYVLWVAPALVFLLVRDRHSGARALLWTAAVAAPWVIFATLYYGSPVPNTIVAKSLAFSPTLPSVTDLGGWADFLWTSLKAHQRDWTSMTPFLEQGFLVHAPLPDALSKLIGWSVGALALVGAVTGWRRSPGLRPAIAFVFLWIAYRIVFLTIGYFDWYGVPTIALIVILAAAGLDRVTVRAPRVVVAVPAVLLGFAYAMHIPFTLPIEYRVQHQIEDRVRDPLGRYLGEVTKPGETIVTEPSGYFGYYTNATLLDYPGLTSTTVTDALREHPEYRILIGLVPLFDPDWIVFRPDELAFLRYGAPEVAARYRVVREFSVPPEESSLEQWGLEAGNYDRDFIVLRRRDDGPP
ncbi:MAG: hypothetical protein ACHQJ5_04230 [Vicinamibacteria bacterium]